VAKTDNAYNDRLFAGGLRRYLHLARFRFVANDLRQRMPTVRSILELGCHDGRLLACLPTLPEHYVGFDANWEGGLDLARAAWADYPNLSFRMVQSVKDIDLGPNDQFDVSVCLETLEHLPPNEVDFYLAKLAEHTRRYLYVTVPNEIGPVFLAKWLAKTFFYGAAPKYTGSELLNAVIGRTEKITRDQHKGFDYRKLKDQVSRHFDIVSICGLPIANVPEALSFGIAMVAKRA
jgi:2-polyprenyl-3-methyl-5-hydroxy-6-metoxy-1,4-benzoquinol methylase